MTAKEMIEILKNVVPDRNVILNFGYSNSYSNIKTLKIDGPDRTIVIYPEKRKGQISTINIDKSDFLLIKTLISERYCILKDKIDNGKKDEVCMEAFYKIENLYIKYCKR